MTAHRLMATLTAGGWLLSWGFSGCGSGGGASRGASYAQLVAQRDATMDLLREERAAAQVLRAKLKPFEFTSDQVVEFHRLGMVDPVATICSDLRKHPELIPYNPVPRGQAQFYFVEGATRIVPPRWVVADFEDGHGGGSMLLEFTVLDSVRVDWKRLACSME